MPTCVNCATDVAQRGAALTLLCSEVCRDAHVALLALNGWATKQGWHTGYLARTSTAIYTRGDELVILSLETSPEVL